MRISVVQGVEGGGDGGGGRGQGHCLSLHHGVGLGGSHSWGLPGLGGGARCAAVGCSWLDLDAGAGSPVDGGAEGEGLEVGVAEIGSDMTCARLDGHASLWSSLDDC